MRPFLGRRDADEHDSVLSSSQPKEPCGQDQRLGRVPAGLLAAVHASGREQLEPLFRPILEADISDLTLEFERSRREDAQSFPEEPLDDPWKKNSILRLRSVERRADSCEVGSSGGGMAEGNETS